jgi:hypothetical protein
MWRVITLSAKHTHERRGVKKMEQWQEEGFSSEEEFHEFQRSMAEQEERAEFIMSFVAGGGLSSEANIAWANHTLWRGE